jgi:predicted methyltransferase
MGLALMGGCTPRAVPLPDAPAVPARSAEDQERDARSRPELVLPMLQLQPGARVLDFLTGGGYYAELLAAEVGPSGAVLAHNNAAYRKWVGPKVGERFEGRGLAQVELYDRELEALGLASGSLDAILLVNCYHDLYFADADNDWPAVDAHVVMRALVDALRPGGRLVVVDHHAREGTGAGDAQALHRIERAFAVADWERVGLRLVDSTEVPGAEDQRTRSVFEPEVRGRTDRFVLAFERVD